MFCILCFFIYTKCPYILTMSILKSFASALFQYFYETDIIILYIIHRYLLSISIPGISYAVYTTDTSSVTLWCICVIYSSLFNRDMQVCHIHKLSKHPPPFFARILVYMAAECQSSLSLLFLFPVHTTMTHSSKALLQLSLLHRAQPCESSCISMAFFSLWGSLYNLLRAYLGGNTRSRGVQTHIWSGMRHESWDSSSARVGGRQTRVHSGFYLICHSPQFHSQCVRLELSFFILSLLFVLDMTGVPLLVLAHCYKLVYV